MSGSAAWSQSTRPGFAVPGDVGRDVSVGTILPIRDGVDPAADPDDLFDELSLVLGPLAALGEAATAG